jgi:hypothetical protein
MRYQGISTACPIEEGHVRDHSESGENEEVPSDVDKGHNQHQIAIF